MTLARSLVVCALVGCGSRTAHATPLAPDCPPSCRPFAVLEKPTEHAPGRWYPGFAMRTVALRGSSERTLLDGASKNDSSVSLDEGALAYINKGAWSARYADLFTIGAGSGGLELGLAADAAVGFRARVAATHGPFIRLGFRAEWRHRGRYHASVIELPQLQLGYSVLLRHFQLDVGARGGVALIGRFGLDDTGVHRLGGAPEVGGYVGLGLFPIRLEGELGQTSPADSPVNRFDALVCGAIELPRVCMKAEWLSGDVTSRGEHVEATARSIGLTIGVGAVEWR